jgi:predicted RNase H-like nuclease (RuvC/YqgF family)
MYKWIHKYSKIAKQNISIVEDHQSASEKVKEFQKRIENLERIVGLKQLELDYLHKLIDTAQTEFGIDIKKNVSTSHLDTSWKKINEFSNERFVLSCKQLNKLFTSTEKLNVHLKESYKSYSFKSILFVKIILAVGLENCFTHLNQLSLVETALSIL